MEISKKDLKRENTQDQAKKIIKYAYIGSEAIMQEYLMGKIDTLLGELQPKKTSELVLVITSSPMPIVPNATASENSLVISMELKEKLNPSAKQTLLYKS
jgi:hypothetical protein